MDGNPFYTRLCEEYGCEYPIVSFSHTRDVAVAVSNAGGIGVLGGGLLTTDELRQQIRWIRERVEGKPFGVDLVIPASVVEGTPEELAVQIPQRHRDFVERVWREHEFNEPKRAQWGDMTGGVSRLEMMRMARDKLEVVADERVPIFTSGMGNPAFIMERMHSQGVKVWGLVGLARQAQREIEAGIDLIVAQGSDSGGHSGRIGTFSLVPEVVELARETDTPVIAAGGITTGQHLLAALSLGAVGVWTGTIWQATHESEADPHVKRRLVAGKTEDAIQHKFRDGKQMRGLRNKFIEAWQQEGAPEPLPMPLQGMLVAKMLQAIEDWDMDDWKNVPSGQGVGFIRDIKPARQVVFDMMEEAQDAFERLTAGVSSTAS